MCKETSTLADYFKALGKSLMNKSLFFCRQTASLFVNVMCPRRINIPHMNMCIRSRFQNALSILGLSLILFSAHLSKSEFGVNASRHIFTLNSFFNAKIMEIQSRLPLIQR